MISDNILNLGPATLRHLQKNALPNTIDLKNFSEKELRELNIPLKSILEIRDRLIKKLLNLKK